MKKTVIAALIAVAALVMAGCLRVDFNIEVNKDGTGSLNGVYAMSTDYFSEDDLKSSGKEIKHYTFNGKEYIGYDLSEEYEDYEEMCDLLVNKKENGSALFSDVNIEKKEGFFQTTYIFDAETAAASSEGGSSSQLGSLDSMIDVNITVKLPGKVTVVEGGRVNDEGIIECDYSSTGGIKIHAESAVTNTIAIVIIVAIIVFALIGAAVVVIIIIAVSKKKKAPVVPATVEDDIAALTNSTPSSPDEGSTDV